MCIMIERCRIVVFQHTGWPWVPTVTTAVLVAARIQSGDATKSQTNPGSGWSPKGVRIEVKLQKDLFEHCTSESVLRSLDAPKICCNQPQHPKCVRSLFWCLSFHLQNQRDLLISTHPGASEPILRLFKQFLDWKFRKWHFSLKNFLKISLVNSLEVISAWLPCT
jgi:hypothetical protein